ncbi:hypothetical protein [Acidithiobacillus sp.]|uniref:hypothetical protein n=1 Tax=Acidithiobacillus sp. TaxID=1872118 RepID=UPI002630C2BD|nr:hypothetical protein [Acidithiobacillus sp.]
MTQETMKETSKMKPQEHHKEAAEHHERAANHHKEASKLYETGDPIGAAHQAHSADGHSTFAKEHEKEASKKHASTFGVKK